jgi:hypothetical protein
MPRKKECQKEENLPKRLWQKHDYGALTSLNSRLNIKGNLVFSIENGGREQESTGLFKLGRNLFENK